MDDDLFTILKFISIIVILTGIGLGMLYITKSDDAKYCQDAGFNIHWDDFLLEGAEVVKNNSTHMYINCCEFRLGLVNNSLYKNSLYCKGIMVKK